ncbi:MAG: hypothetical protein ABI581_07330 [Sediminibacterium sp.]
MKKVSLLHTASCGIFFFALAGAIFSCREGLKNNAGQQDSIISTAVAQNLQKPVSSYNDTLNIGVVSAVFYNPDTIQLEKIRSVNKEMVYKSLVHECFYQMRNARIVLKKYWPDVPIIETSKARYLRFTGQNKKDTVIDLNKRNDIGGIFLFDRKKDPIQVDMMNIDTELNFYFKKP